MLGAQVDRNRDCFLEVSNTSSPIFGAAMSIAADSLPVDVGTVVATLVPASDMTPSETSYTRVGPVAEISVIDI